MRRPPSVTANLALRADRHLGERRLVVPSRAHHRRRLERVGWLVALDAPGGDWAAGDPQPRQRGSLEVLIDGAEVLPRMVAELERAESHVHIAGWYFSPDFALTREGEPAILRNLLAELAERVEVRVLVWVGDEPLGRVHYHAVPHLPFPSAIVMGRQLIDAFPDEFPLDGGGHGHEGM